jgi:hypothetical protein
MSTVTGPTLTSFREGYDKRTDESDPTNPIFYRTYKAYCDRLWEVDPVTASQILGLTTTNIGIILSTSAIKFDIGNVGTDPSSLSDYNGNSVAWLNERNIIYDKHKYGIVGITESFEIQGQLEVFDNDALTWGFV